MWGSVRLCRPRDIGAVMELVREIAALHRVAPGDVRTDGNVLMAAAFGDPPLFECFVAEPPPGEKAPPDGQPLAGYVLSVYTYSARGGATLYMDNLYVRPHFRGRKLGRRLMEEAAKAAWARGCRELRMHVGGPGGGSWGALEALGGAALPGGGRFGWRLLNFDEGGTRRLAGVVDPPPK